MWSTERRAAEKAIIEFVRQSCRSRSDHDDVSAIAYEHALRILRRELNVVDRTEKSAIKPTPQQLLAALTLSWGPDTVRKGDDWLESVPSLNQCVPTALVVQDYFGGSIYHAPLIIRHKPHSHYWNAFTEYGNLDFAGGQFVFLRSWPNYNQMKIRDRAILLANNDVVQRYQILSARVGVWLRWLCKDAI